MSETVGTPIDLTLLPAPQVVEPLDFEQILAAMLADLRSRDPQFDALVESDPAYKILEVAAYRELLLRQRVNDAARSVMLAYAESSDLDQLAALYGVQRLVVDPGDPAAVPPVAPTYESDTALRRRVQLAPESWTSAGSRGAYQYHGMTADPQVKDVGVYSPSPGEVLVTVLSTVGGGTASDSLLAAVDAALSAETVRPLCDGVTVQTAQIVNYTIQAALTLHQGPDAETVRQEALAAAQNYATQTHRLGRDVTLSGVYAALHQPGVQRVRLISPLADLVISPQQAAWCTDIIVVVEGRGE
ncbi:baseplate assembly protein [Geoalkalibacter subterraneus]|uniref:Baseplate assembly protein n=1 Tax=Geoalkalibacter subterraneus TaxID=483547 RepID=A0A0B5FHT7_9BACT|nr:baseplate J/gp47 family protein [Geoalkalibacter subterraneus]AJF07757.1 baseplate assembly protein [Geoalkalibacter subterraneus]